MLVKAKLFLDTSMCIDVARGNVPPYEWKAVWQLIKRKYRYVMSPLTLTELLVGVGRTKHESFDKQREAIRVLYAVGRKEFLRMPGHFVLETVFGDTRKKANFEPRDFELWTRTILAARDRQSLAAEGVKLNVFVTKRFGFDFNHIDRELQKGRHEFVEALRDLRRGNLVKSSPNVWAAGVLRRIGGPSDPQSISRLLTALDAAYNFDLSIWNLVCCPIIKWH